MRSSYNTNTLNRANIYLFFIYLDYKIAIMFTELLVYFDWVVTKDLLKYGCRFK